MDLAPIEWKPLTVLPGCQFLFCYQARDREMKFSWLLAQASSERLPVRPVEALASRKPSMEF
jgi:hypothetical protein